MKFTRVVANLAAAGALALAAITASNTASADGFGARRSVKDFGPPPFSWTGFYAGLNAGYAWGDMDYSLAAGGAWVGVGGDPAWLAANGSPNIDANGFIGGVQAGYNWQSGNIVLGLETDISWLSAEGERATGNLIRPSGFPTSFTETASVDWLFTLRARLGMTLGTNLLVYATGGLAVADVNVSQTLGFPAVPGVATYAVTETRTGWTLGAGLEWALNRNWTLKGEYLYVDLGSSSGGSAISTATTFTHSHAVDMSLNIVRAGINYKF